MNRKLWAIVVVASFLIGGCSTSPVNTSTNSTNNSSQDIPVGSLEINVSNGDAQDVTASLGKSGLAEATHLWLTIKEIQVNVSGNSWQTVAQPNARFDFLVLVNDLTQPLHLYPLPAGKYTQIRLILAEQPMDGAASTVPPNEVIIGGKSYPIVVPSGSQTGIKCNHPITIKENETTEICLQFDILKALHVAADSTYIMHPTYKMIACSGSWDW